MAGLNRVCVLGRLGRDPESRNFQNGGKVVNLRVAVSERFKDREGNMKERTEWIPVAIFNEKLGEVAEKYLVKGSEVYLEGAMETRKYTDQQGVEKFTTEVVLRQFRGELVLIGGRREGAGDDDGEGASRGTGGGGRSNGGGWDNGGGRGGGTRGPSRGGPPKGGFDDGDDIPFGPEWR